MCIASERPQSKPSWQCSPAGRTDHLTCVNIIKSFQRRWLDCWRCPTKHWSLLQYVGVGFDHLWCCYSYVIRTIQYRMEVNWIVVLWFSYLSLFRNWCPQTVTKTVTCQVQNGTTLQRVYQTCRWPQGCNGGRWVYYQHTLTRCLYHFRELPLQPVQ